VRTRQIAPVALVLGLTIAGFFGARLLGERDARRDSQRRAEVAAAQIQGRLAQGGALAESLRRFMESGAGTGVSSEEFESNASRWLSPAGFPAAAWVQRVPASRRAQYERRLGHPIVTRDQNRRIVPVGSRSSYLAATLVSGIPPMAVPGIDLGGERGIARAVARASKSDDATSTSPATLRDGTKGFFLTRSAPRLTGDGVEPGFVVVFASDSWLRAGGADTAAAQLTGGDGPGTEGGDGATVRRSFTEAGQRFDVVLPQGAVQDAAAALPWIILAGGLVAALLGGALGWSAARRTRAQGELDRIFTLSSDLITVADFDGRFTRVNPATEHVLGYTEEELVGRPYLDLVHPDDRGATAVEADAIGQGRTTLSFENRFVRRDGSHRVLEWTSTPDVKDGLMYGMARDVTERRRAESELERLATDQAALRRVATLVAQAIPPSGLFHAVAHEVGALLGADLSGMLRYEDDGTVTTVATWAEAGEHPPVPDRWRTEPGDPTTMIAETRKPARVDDWTTVPGPIAAFLRDEVGVRSSVGSPIVVEGRLWGALAVHSKLPAPLPPETETRMAQFTDLVATAIANAEARAEVERLADEQAALRRVATLIARAAPPEELFNSVSKEVGTLLGADLAGMSRYEDDDMMTILPPWSAASGHMDMPGRVSLESATLPKVIRDTGRPAREDAWDEVGGEVAELTRDQLGIRSAVGSPIVVEGRVWGALFVSSTQSAHLPGDTESRLENFTDLVATAIANAEARAEVERLADEQAALRRVATLVAEGAPPTAVFDAVAAEMEALLEADQVALNRFEPGAEIVVLAHRGLDAARTPVGSRVSHEGESVTATVQRTGRPARMEHHEGAPGALAELARETGLRVSVGAPIVVDRGLWGIITASWKGEQSPPADTEERMAHFTELLDTAIANAEARAELMASRARVVAAWDDARRRFERDLHDGVQQRLVWLSLELRGAELMAPSDNEELVGQLAEIAEGLARTHDEVRELSRGIHPAILSKGGLVPALKALARRSAVPVELDLAVDGRLGDHVEVGSYYVVSEALTNVAKHAQASVVEVRARTSDGVLELAIDDDGVGGADPARGSGLIGLTDRVAALGGTIAITSPPGGGTSLRVDLPLAS
jgi:PAS domain S-box-containing protein